jgi:hypothetical protein
MSAKPAPRHLRIIDDQGEVTEFACPHCQHKEDELAELVRKFRGQSRELAELRRDKDAEARAHEAWPTAIKLFDYWKLLTKHSKAKWSEDRFWVLLPSLKNFGAGNCAAAIAGIAHDPNTRVQRNGKTERYDDFATCFGSAGRVERYAKRRPKDWTLPEQFEEEGKPRASR